MAKQEKKTQVENKSNVKVNYPLGKINFILMGVCLVLIIIGFWLMTGSATWVTSSTRTCLRPAA